MPQFIYALVIFVYTNHGVTVTKIDNFYDGETCSKVGEEVIQNQKERISEYGLSSGNMIYKCIKEPEAVTIHSH